MYLHRHARTAVAACAALLSSVPASTARAGLPTVPPPIENWGYAAFSNIDGLGQVAALDAGWNHMAAILKDGRVACWGEGAYGQLVRCTVS
jgi:hypothetical protein